MSSRPTGIDAASAIAAHAAGMPLVDVRERDELELISIPSAIHLPLGDGVEGVLEQLSMRNVPGLVICAAGYRSTRVTNLAAVRGIDGWTSIDGGIESWTRAGGMTTGPETPFDPIRFERQVRLPQVGVAGQRRLASARVLVVGAGGLGVPAITYLASAGVGCLGIADPDVVARSNLHRQPLYVESDVGLAKVHVAARRVAAIAPQAGVDARVVEVDADNVDDLLAEGWDVVVDGTDAIDARYALAAAAVRAAVPVVHGSVHRFEGRVTVFAAGGRPCWSCLHPERPSGALAPNCSDAGVLGVVPALIGIQQAAETLKLLLGVGTPLTGRLAIHDLLDARSYELAIPARDGCGTCGLRPDT